MPDLTLKVPPVIVVLLFGGAMWIAASFNSWAMILFPASEIMAVVIAFMGSALIAVSAAEFMAEKTTVNPLTPELATTMVTKGVYRFSRNPMYLGFLIWLAAWGVFLENSVAILLLPLFIGYMNRFQIIPEEKALLVQFGEEYVRYLKSTPRWLL